jgi:hypothetical protein
MPAAHSLPVRTVPCTLDGVSTAPEGCSSDGAWCSISLHDLNPPVTQCSSALLQRLCFAACTAALRSQTDSRRAGFLCCLASTRKAMPTCCCNRRRAQLFLCLGLGAGCDTHDCRRREFPSPSRSEQGVLSDKSAGPMLSWQPCGFDSRGAPLSVVARRCVSPPSHNEMNLQPPECGSGTHL